MGYTQEEADAMRQRTEAARLNVKPQFAGKNGNPTPDTLTSAVLVSAVTFLEDLGSERKLHKAIMAHCDGQWPRWKYIHARMDKRSTVAVGAPDFVIFSPGNAEMHPRVFAIECKRAGQKPTPEQLAWHKEMEMLGHKVHVIYSLAEFFEIVK